MNRHNAYINGHKGSFSRESGNLSISPHRFRPQSQPALRRRRQLLIRLGLAAGCSLLLALLFFPSFRTTFKTTLSLGLLAPVVIGPELPLETVRSYDLSNSDGTARGWEREERVLMCAPLRDAETHLPMFFGHLHNFTYPHRLIDLAFLVSDSKDNTLTLLNRLLTELQNDPDPKQPYGEISVIEKDFGQKVNQDVESRHGFAAQASRRKLMAQARNWLLSAALRPTHSWVYWRDVDVETAPFTILEDLMRHNKDVIVPNVWRPLPDWLGGEQPYDLNSWQESETALALADTLDEDAVIVEGYAEYATWRPHLAYLRDPYGDPDMEMEIDGVGGVSILAKASVFRAGVHFPAFSFEKHAETEGFGKMAKRMGFSVVGLPHYTVWHLYEPSVDDIRHMEEMEQERKNREDEERERAERMKKIKDEFNDPGSEWEKDKTSIEGISQQEDQIRKEHDAAMADKEAKDQEPTEKSTKEKSDETTSKETKKAGEGTDTQKTDGKEAKDTKEATVAKDAGETTDGKVSKDAEGRKNLEEGTPPKDNHDTKAVKEDTTSKDNKDAKAPKEKSDDGAIKSTKEAKGDKTSGDTEPRKEISKDESTKNAKAAKDDTTSKDNKAGDKYIKDPKAGKEKEA